MEMMFWAAAAVVVSDLWVEHFLREGFGIHDRSPRLCERSSVCVLGSSSYRRFAADMEILGN
jgi:hypothetical protein